MLEATGQMKTYLSSIASLLFVVLGCIQTLLGAVQPDFAVAANPVAVQLHVGGRATSQISSSSDNGFSGSIQLACQSLPPTISCNFTPPALQLEGAVAVSSQLTISAVQSNAAMLDSGQKFMVLAMVPILGGIFFWRGTGAICKAALLVLLASLMLVSGCQGLAPPPSPTRLLLQRQPRMASLIRFRCRLLYCSKEVRLEFIVVSAPIKKSSGTAHHVPALPGHHGYEIVCV